MMTERYNGRNVVIINIDNKDGEIRSNETNVYLVTFLYSSLLFYIFQLVPQSDEFY